MNGPAHYREAENLIDWAYSTEARGGGHAERALAAAQVHATLALVAATAEQRDHTPQHSWGGTSTLLESQSEWDGAINQ